MCLTDVILVSEINSAHLRNRDVYCRGNRNPIVNGQALFGYLASKLQDKSSGKMVLCIRAHGNILFCRFT